VRGELVLEQVRFGYNPAQPVLHDLDLQVRPGQVVALVGPSGAGKSTLFSLLLRFNTAQQGRVLLDGHDLADLRARELRRAVALVPQQSSVFSGTVAEAIAFGRPASEAAIRQAASLANAAGFIEALPQGYASRIEERGSNFSGGQLQRLAIARAVYGMPKYVVMDEPNSNLDEVGENALVATVQALKANGSTVVLTTHRPRLVGVVDKMLVLKGGRVEMFGPRDQVMARLTQPAAPAIPQPAEAK
jgi:ATP-binding cassette subfamily B protein